MQKCFFCVKKKFAKIVFVNFFLLIDIKFFIFLFFFISIVFHVIKSICIDGKISGKILWFKLILDE